MEQFFNSYSGTIAALSLIVAIIALVIAYIALIDQKRCKFTVKALPMVASNNIYYGFDALENPQLTITNFGSKAVTIVDISICVGKERYPISQVHNKRINIYIEPGKTEYYTYKRDWAIDVVTSKSYKKDYVVCWEVKANNGKIARCKSNNRVSGFINVNLSGEKKDDQT